MKKLISFMRMTIYVYYMESIFESSIAANGESPDLLFEDFMNKWKISERNQSF